MTRLDLLKLVIARARANGFEFRRWYTRRMEVPWISPTAAVTLLESQRRYYALLFSHEFAESFWRAGEPITFQVPSSSFQRTMPDGTSAIVQRKGFTRRSARRDAWRYHLREMAAAEDPLRYIRKYLNIEEQLQEDPDDLIDGLNKDLVKDRPRPIAHPGRPAKKTTPKFLQSTAPAKKSRPLPKDLPTFLKRPYPPQS